MHPPTAPSALARAPLTAALRPVATPSSPPSRLAAVLTLASLCLVACEKKDTAGEGAISDAVAPMPTATEKADSSAPVFVPAGMNPAVVAPARSACKTLDTESVSVTVHTNKPALMRQCWGSEAEKIPKASVSVAVVVADDGQVTSAKATGDHVEVARCIERQVRKWHFECGGTAVIPFYFTQSR